MSPWIDLLDLLLKNEYNKIIVKTMKNILHKSIITSLFGLTVSLWAAGIEIIHPESFGSEVQQKVEFEAHPFSYPSLPQLEYALRLNWVDPFSQGVDVQINPQNNSYFYQSARLAISPYYNTLGLYLGTSVLNSKVWKLGGEAHYNVFVWNGSNIEMSQSAENTDFTSQWNDRFIASNAYRNTDYEYSQSINFSYWLGYQKEKWESSILITHALIDVKSSKIYNYDYRYEIPFTGRDRFSQYNAHLGYFMNDKQKVILNCNYITSKLYSSAFDFILEFNESSGSTANLSEMTLGFEQGAWTIEAGMFQRRSLVDVVNWGNLLLKASWKKGFSFGEYKEQ